MMERFEPIDISAITKKFDEVEASLQALSDTLGCHKDPDTLYKILMKERKTDFLDFISYLRQELVSHIKEHYDHTFLMFKNRPTVFDIPETEMFYEHFMDLCTPLCMFPDDERISSYLMYLCKKYDRDFYKAMSEAGCFNDKNKIEILFNGDRECVVIIAPEDELQAAVKRFESCGLRGIQKTLDYILNG